MLRFILVLSVALLTSCGPKVDPSPAAAVSFPVAPAGSLGRALDELIVKTTDVDRRTRLSTFRSLWDASARWPENARRDLERSLRLLIEIEQRGLDEEMGPLTRVGDDGSGAIAVDSTELLDMGTEEETLGAVDEGQAPDPQPTASGDRFNDSKEALAASDYRKALGLLDDDHHAGTLTAAEEKLWGEAVEGFVRAERERAGDLFVAAREMSAGSEKTAKISEVVAVLEGLLREYPGSRYESAIRRNLDIVRQEMGPDDAKED
jgi:hypothetical protein